MIRPVFLSPPKVENSLSHLYWEFHEAAYTLAGSWPSNLVCHGIPELESVVIGGRGIYAPSSPFNLKSMNDRFKKIFEALRKAVNNGEIISVKKMLFLDEKIYGNRMSYLMRPKDVIYWALLQGFLLPNDLCHVLGINQLPSEKPSKSLHHSVRIRVIGQYVLSEMPKSNIEEICEHRHWMKRFGPRRISSQTTRRALNNLFDSEGKRGRQQPISSRVQCRTYIPKPIREILHVSDDGVLSYNFPLLKTMVLTAIDIKRQIIGQEAYADATLLEFLHLFKNDPLFKMYLTESLKFVAQFITTVCIEKLTESFHYKMFSFTPEKFRNTKIKDLHEINKLFILERFTEEERRLINTSSSS